MTIKEMHIGIDLGIQRLNSNVFGKLLPEAKDYYINTVTQEFVKLALTDEKNTVFDIATYTDIRSYYEKLQKYIRTIQLGLIKANGEGYVYGYLPTSIPVTQITSGVLYHGAYYKVLIAGTTNLSTYGYKSTPVVGETFECIITPQTGASISIVSGEKYRIINCHGADFTTVGAASNTPGLEFTATSSATVTGGTSTQVQNLTDTPSWAASTTLVPVADIGYYINLSSRSSVTYGSPITSGTLTVGKKYIVSVPGTADLSSVGGVTNPDVGYIFACTAATSITWGSTVLYEIEDNGNRLVKVQDIDDFLQNAFGSTKSSPISIFAGDKLRVYHGNKFDIERIYLDYIRKPISVSINDNIDSDLPESVQPFLVDLVVKKIAALSGNPAYSAIVNEVQNKE